MLASVPLTSASSWTLKSSRIWTINVGPVSCIFSVTWLAGDVKEPIHFSQRVSALAISNCFPFPPRVGKSAPETLIAGSTILYPAFFCQSGGVDWC